MKAGGIALLSTEGFTRVAEGDTAAYSVIAASGEWRIVQARPPRGATETPPATQARETRPTPAPG